ncbi:SCO family protein [Hyphomonas sp.]|uniref:SCO family protein n=1 Tax=Hyphomonas sp. TaxID=87 RepID=UPI00391954D5
MTALQTMVRLAAASVCAALISLGAQAHGVSHEPGGKVETKKVSASDTDAKARDYFTDTLLTSHAGEKLKFYSDVLEGRTVVISFMFTTCEDACPLINATLQRIQERLKDRMGKDIFIISITVDPKVDTAPVLASYRKQFKAGPGWLFFTGPEKNVETVSTKMGQVFEKEAHLTALLVGNTKTARWRKIPANLSDAIIVTQIQDIADGTYD